jgi:hypothetical protein
MNVPVRSIWLFCSDAAKSMVVLNNQAYLRVGLLLQGFLYFIEYVFPKCLKTTFRPVS